MYWTQDFTITLLTFAVEYNYLLSTMTPNTTVLTSV